MKNRASIDTCAIVEAGMTRVRSTIKKGSVDAVDSDGRTMLAHAAVLGKQPIVDALIEGGADVNKADKAGWTPLHFAVDNGHRNVARSLLAAEALVDPAERNGNTPLQRAVYWAGRDGTSLIELLLSYGANPRSVNEHGVSILEIAEADEELLRLLKSKKSK